MIEIRQLQKHYGTHRVLTAIRKVAHVDGRAAVVATARIKLATLEL